jgi:DNA polymerase-1
MPPTFYLIDGHALAYRMYFALTAGASGSRWQTSKGEYTAGIYGFTRVLRITERSSWSTSPSRRHRQTFTTRSTAYRARAKMPEELRQIERIRRLVDAFNIPSEMGYGRRRVAQLPAQGLSGAGRKIICDRDLLQLVNIRTAMYPRATIRTTSRRMSFLARRHPTDRGYRYVGDKSDNIPACGRW